MATVKRYIYDFDPTGRESANLIKNERHTITPENRTPQNVLIPGYAPYFRQSLIVKDMITGLPLQEGIDYTCEWPIVHTADNLEGYSPVYGGIQFIDNDITGQFELQYQTIGGQYALDGVTIAQALANQANDPLTTTFEEILGRPIKLPPLEHVHSIDDFVGFEDLVNGVDRLRLAIELLAREDKDSHPGYETLVDVYFKLQQTANDLITKTDNTDARLTSEIQRVTDNTANLINVLREEKNNDVSNLRQDLTNKINTAKAELTNSLNALENDLEGKLNAFKTETGNNFTNVRNSITSNYNDLKGRIDTLVSRADANDQKNIQQDGRLTAIEQKNVQQDNRLSTIETKDAQQDSRLTAIEQKNVEQDGRLSTIEANYVDVRQIAYGDLAKKYGDARNSFISGSALSQQQATESGMSKLSGADYNGLVISNGVQTTQFIVGSPSSVYLRIHDDHTNPSAPWTTTEVLTKASADAVLNELGNVVFTTRDQNIDGHKTYVQPIKFKNSTTTSTNPTAVGRIGFNDNDFWLHNPLSTKFLALKTDGRLTYGGKDLIWKEGNYLRNPINTDTVNGGFEIEKAVGEEKQYWRLEAVANNVNPENLRGAFKFTRTATANGDATAKKALEIYLPNKSGTIAIMSDVDAAVTTIGEKNTQQDNRLAALENKNNQQDTSITNINNRLAQLNGDYVTLNTTQTIIGAKTFTSPVKFTNNGEIIYDVTVGLKIKNILADKYLELHQSSNYIYTNYDTLKISSGKTFLNNYSVAVNENGSHVGVTTMLLGHPGVGWGRGSIVREENNVLIHNHKTINNAQNTHMRLYDDGYVNFHSNNAAGITLQGDRTNYRIYPTNEGGAAVLAFHKIAIQDFYMRSDIRLKENVKPIENALDTVSKLNGYTYNLKGETKGNAGVIAQELQEVLPELVSENSETGMLSVNHISLIGYLIESIKELKKDNDDLRKRINSLIQM